MSPLRTTRPRGQHQRGAALLVALLTVTLVATFAAAALWQQWRATEVEAAERSRLQSAWVLVGALDWSRLILREDALADARIKAGASGSGAGESTKGPADHLGEPWAIPLADVQLRDFLSADQNVAAEQLEGLPEAFLSGSIVDAQSKLNVRNLVANGQPSAQAVAAFQKLFQLLGLPADQVMTLVQGLLRVWPAAPPKTDGQGGEPPATATAAAPDANAPLPPSRVQDLVWLGLPQSTVEAIRPYVTVLPVATTVNINTASVEVLTASADKLDMATAQRLVAHRQREYFDTLQMANALLPSGSAQLSSAMHNVSTQYFEVQGRLRLDRLWVQEQSLLHRNANNLQVLWRDRGAGTDAPPP
ncbi:type II secretion system minor pseudopilin GspK [Xenophilus arseniciresistens]|uniref:Type II secretion system protein K n=1 Tax=Xenophilus arseniciresistens TaxID=1283306 RepID=A0AAE3N733_9BURK|nr:type II secretion system minor pseudopilin GspK [Xenophilus arseniciresistens]MDA7416770.1 type II secretion system minor pseudopilin GspK [Xenophilus arseniciresistens]